ncbi:MAG: hypothetical protein ACK4SO_05475, partial [Candidatus Kapaibacteriota bacterium]
MRKQWLLVIIGMMILNAFNLLPQKVKITDNSHCLSCHDDPTITMTKNGKEISLEVKKHIFSKSVHSSLKCEK